MRACLPRRRPSADVLAFSSERVPKAALGRSEALIFGTFFSKGTSVREYFDLDTSVIWDVTGTMVNCMNWANFFGFVAYRVALSGEVDLLDCSYLCSDGHLQQSGLLQQDGASENLNLLTHLHTTLLDQDWSEAISERRFSLTVRTFAAALSDRAELDAQPACDPSSCGQSTFLETLRSALQGCRFVPTATAAAFLLQAPPDLCCSVLRAAAYVASAEALSHAATPRPLAGAPSEAALFWQRGRAVYIAWLQQLQLGLGGEAILELQKAPGAPELFQVLSRSTCHNAKAWRTEATCQHPQVLQEMVERWRASFVGSIQNCRVWLERMRSESLWIVEFLSSHGGESGPSKRECALEAMAALDSACADSGIKARALLLPSGGVGKTHLAASASWAHRVTFGSSPMQLLQEDCEIPILMLDVLPGKQLEILRGVARLLSHGRIFGILTRPLLAVKSSA